MAEAVAENGVVRLTTVKAAAAAGELGRSCRVLLVDDDPLIRESTAAMLEDLGHQAIEAASAADALEVLRTGQSIDLVVTDHAMPGVTGLQLARQIRKEWPDLPVLLATGYADLPEGEAMDLPLLGKPYTQEELAGHIARLLDLPSALTGTDTTQAAGIRA